MSNEDLLEYNKRLQRQKQINDESQQKIKEYMLSKNKKIKKAQHTKN